MAVLHAARLLSSKAPIPDFVSHPSNGDLEDLFKEELAEFDHDEENSHTEGYLQG
jgi:RNA recognition motif-containing protein